MHKTIPYEGHNYEADTESTPSISSPHSVSEAQNTSSISGACQNYAFQIVRPSPTTAMSTPPGPSRTQISQASVSGDLQLNAAQPFISGYYWPPRPNTTPTTYQLQEPHQQDPFLMETKRMIQDQNQAGKNQYWTPPQVLNPFIPPAMNPYQGIATC
jgi:hypothetical protein